MNVSGAYGLVDPFPSRLGQMTNMSGSELTAKSAKKKSSRRRVAVLLRSLEKLPDEALKKLEAEFDHISKKRNTATERVADTKRSH